MPIAHAIKHERKPRRAARGCRARIVPPLRATGFIGGGVTTDMPLLWSCSMLVSRALACLKHACRSALGINAWIPYPGWQAPQPREGERPREP